MRDDAALNNDYRSAPNRPGPAHDEQAIGKYDLRNDKVSVIHSGESDEMPNREAQDAYADDVTDAAGVSGDVYAANPTDHNPGADAITAMDVPEEEPVADVDEIPMNAHTGDPENPTAAGGVEKEDDDNDFEYQQQLGEGSGPGPDEDTMVGKEDVA